MSSKVYITQDNKKNYAPAYHFGEPLFITSLEYSAIKNSDSNLQIHANIAKAIESFNPDEDYVLLSGDPVVIALVLHEALTEYGYVRILKWQSQDRMYIPITLSNQGIDNVVGS